MQTYKIKLRYINNNHTGTETHTVEAENEREARLKAMAIARQGCIGIERTMEVDE